MNQQISSELTIFHKFIEPIIGLTIVVTLLFSDFFPTDIPVIVKYIFYILAIAGFIASCYFFWPLKKVTLDGETLWVSDFFQDIMIPISNIVRIEESRAFNRRRIILHLKESNEFGEKIIFIPKRKFDPYQLKCYYSEKPLNVIRKRKPLPEALRLYWPCLIGVALFPSFAFISTSVYKLPFDYLIIPFIVVSFLAAWPMSSGKASYAFWIVAMIVFMAGAFLAALLSQILKPVAG